MLFLGRALGILSGLATGIDPQFNVFAAAEPFAKQMIAIDQSKTIEEAIVSQVVEIGGAMVRFPLQADRLTSLLLRGDAHVHVNDTDKLIREMHRLNRTMNRLVWVLMFAATLLAAIMLDAGGHTDASPWALAAAVIALVLAFWGR
jgi:predicted unusual protein kinase regulating ubiquinone biosynthesis (AarF/ABC1/UbiB family)